MRTVLIGNTRTEEMVGDLTALSEQSREAAAHGAHRLLWWAREGDVLVLPTLPDEAFADYVAALTGTPPGSFTVLAPAPGRLGSGLLTPDRLADPALEDALREALHGPGGHRRTAAPAGLRITPVYPDATVADLARRLGAEAALPGWAFHAQGGSALVNSKAAFRAVAAGAGVAIARGTVVNDRGEAVRAIGALLGEGRCAIAKREFGGGGLGNEILTPVPGIEPAGAPRAVLLPDGAAIDAYVADRWAWLTEGGRRRLVVEQYHVGAVPVYAEFVVADDRVELTGTGEMLTDPVVIGEIVPASARLTDEATAELTAAGRHLCEAYRALGYRGTISADAYVTVQGEIRFCEANGRITGSTHLHTAMAGRLLDPAVRRQRVLLGGECAAPPFPATAAALEDAGLGFDPASGTGVVLVNAFGPRTGAVMYCVIAEDVTGARARQAELVPVLAKAAS